MVHCLLLHFPAAFIVCTGCDYVPPVVCVTIGLTITMMTSTATTTTINTVKLVQLKGRSAVVFSIQLRFVLFSCHFKRVKKVFAPIREYLHKLCIPNLRREHFCSKELMCALLFIFSPFNFFCLICKHFAPFITATMRQKAIAVKRI